MSSEIISYYYEVIHSLCRNMFSNSQQLPKRKTQNMKIQKRPLNAD